MFSFLLGLAAVATINYDIPKQFQQPTTVVIMLTDQAGIDKDCGKQSDKNFTTLGCVDTKGLLHLPNPCKYKEYKNPNSYARLLCHEVGHTEGWHHPNE